MAYVSYQYKMRTSGPMSMDGGNFYAHTFMAEENEVVTYEATACFVTSQDMMGQFKDDGTVGDYLSASYTSLNYTSPGVNGPVIMFQGEEIKRPNYLSEENIGRGIPKIIT